MKLVELLARELVEWPEGAACIVQDYVGKIKADKYFNPLIGISGKVWVREEPHQFIIHAKLATDHATAIITREMWEAERARIAGKKEGWIRNLGGECPIEDGVLVDVRHRNWQVIANVPALSSVSANIPNWAHDTPHKVAGDIMAYRLHKPEQRSEVDPVSPEQIQVGIDAADAGKTTPLAEVKAKHEASQVEANIVEVFNPQIGQIDGPIKWRDRIREIDTTVEALEEERVALVQQLEGEGFQLIAVKVKPDVDVGDWRNWKVGDLISVDADEYSSYGVFKLTHFDYRDTKNPVHLDRCGWPEINSMKWHSRP